MFGKYVLASKLIFLAIFLAGCTTLAGAEPTPDVDLVKTEAVQTAMAELTTEALSNPTTETIVPTQTQEPTQTLPPAWTATSAAPTPTTVSSTNTPLPTSKPVYSGPRPTETERVLLNYDCDYVSWSPADGVYMEPGEHFDGRWTLKNVGSNPWRPDEFRIYFNNGDQMSANDIYDFSDTVLPGESVTIVIDMIAPAQPGLYIGRWHLRSDNNNFFCPFHVAIQVP